MATFLRTNSSSSISSLSSVGSDNAEVLGKNGKPIQVQDPNKNRNLMQRTRDALGDIGNRLKKNQGPVAGKAALKKETTGTSSQFAIPQQRPPRVAKPKSKLNEKSSGKHLSTAKAENTAAPVPSGDATTEPTPVQTKNSPKVVETLYKLDDVKTGNYSEQTVPFQEEVEDKENIPEKSEDPAFEPDAETENEYDPKLGTELAVEAFGLDQFNVVNIDVDEWNPLLVQVYIQDIYDYVFALEKKYPIKIRYLEGRIINSRMRAVLLDWLIEVHAQFGFMPETLFLAAKILDRNLQANRHVSRKQLQLVGVTAMYVAAKYEEVCTPAVQDFAAVSDNAFTVADVIKMEQDVLKTLSFELAFPPAVLFLRRFSKAANATMAIHSMAKYIMELSIVDYAACHLFPSEQAAGALALALLILENKSLTEVWNPTIEHYSRYTIESIKPIVSILAGVLSRAQEDAYKLKAVYKKYSGKRLNNTSLAPELKVEAWKSRILKEVCKLQM